jgi:ABC-type transport system involved in cytochrome c biogenesis permease subunit
MVRIRKTVLPLQSAYAVFFLTAFVVLITVMRPAQISSTYTFAVIVVFVALAVTMIEAFKVTRAPC